MKENIEINFPQASHIQIEVYYAKGGMNYFNYKNEPRGYYVSVTPVTLEEGLMSFTAFSGVKQFLNACGRKSDKEYKAALKRLTPEIKNFLIETVKAKLNAKSALNAISKEINISLPARFEGMTKAEILSLPVHIVDGKTNSTYPNLESAQKVVDLKKLCGPFGSEKRDHLRFETPEVARILSA